jgi:hypothetical protein
MFLILLGLFLTFTAFALDLGNCYLWVLRLDKAARAGSLAGLGFRGIQGWTYVSSPAGTSALINATKLAVQDNLRAYGFTLDPNNITVTYDSSGDSISVTIRHNPSTVLIGKLDRILNFGFNSQTDAGGNPTPLSSTLSIQRQHQANLNTANVVLIIDVSGSMLCPAVGSCACRLSNTCNPANSKLARLVVAVQRFAQHFNPNRDRIAVIPFNLAAQRLFSFTDGRTLRTATNRLPIPNGNGTPGNLLAANSMTAETFLTTTGGILDQALRNLAGSNTNHCDALTEGIFELEGVSGTLFGAENSANPATDRKNLQPFVVLFTDGAPNAMRGIFKPGDIPPGHCKEYRGNFNWVNAGNCATDDFYHYAIEWVTADGGGTKYYRGPGPFVERALDSNGIPKLFNHPIGLTELAPLYSKTCGVVLANGNPVDFEKTITRNTSTGPSGRGDPLLGCLNSSSTEFSFSIPYTNPNSNNGNNAYLASVSGVPISTDNTTWWDPNWPLTFFPPTIQYGLQKYDELPYYCAIEAADYIRTRFAGTIFTVGLGDGNTHLSPTGQAPTCNEPLQDPDDHTSRKDFFLTRLAFARSMFTNQLLPTSVRSHYQIAGSQSQKDVSNCSDHRLKDPDRNTTAPPVPFVGYTSDIKDPDGDTTFKDLRPLRPASMDTILVNNNGTRRMETQGEYFPTDNADEIPRIFDLIAKTILLRSAS